MSQRFIYRILLLLLVAVAVYSQENNSGDGGADGSSIVSKPIEIPDSVKQPKTNGIVGNLEKALWPLTQIFLQMLESYLKNMYGKSLPCRLESIAPLKGECTDLKQA